MCCRNHPQKQRCRAGREKNRSAWRRRGVLPVSAGASHPGVLFFRDLSTERWRSVHTERPVWVVRFTIATFHLHSSSPVCACCLQLLSLFSPAPTPLTPPSASGPDSRRPSSGIKAASSSASSPTHQCCAAVVAGPLTPCWNCVPCSGARSLRPAWASLSRGPRQQSKT